MKFPVMPLALIAVLGLSAQQAHAALPPLGEVYVGATLGAAFAAPKGLDAVDNQRAQARTSGGLFIGTAIGALPVGEGWPLALELGYQDIARHRITYRTAGGTTDLTAKGRSVSLALKVDVPLTDAFSLYGKLGAARNQVDGSTPAGQTPIDIDGRSTGTLTAVGAQYRFDRITVRAEIASFGKASPKANAGGASVGVAMRF